MKKFKTLAETVRAIRGGGLDEAKVRVVMDNDKSNVYYGPCEDSEGNEIENCIYEGKGDADTEDLWVFVFPKAKVGWC